MLFEVMFKDQPTSIVLNKIVAICESKSGDICCHIYTDGDQEGFNCTEEYSVVSARLHAALEKAEAQKFLTTCKGTY